MLIPEHIRKHLMSDWDGSDTGQTDGNKYFTPPELTHFRYFSIEIVDTPGAAGTNTYTLEASMDNSTWIDVTNAWTGSASYTTHAYLNPDRVRVAKYLRIKRVRSGDAANNDGGSAVYVRYMW